MQFHLGTLLTTLSWKGYRIKTFKLALEYKYEQIYILNNV